MDRAQRGGKHFRSGGDRPNGETSSLDRRVDRGTTAESPTGSQEDRHDATEAASANAYAGVDGTGSDGADQDGRLWPDLPAGDGPHAHGTSRRGGRGHRHTRHHRRHVAATVICVVVALVALAGFGGYRFYRSARTVASSAQAMVSKTGELENSLRSGDGDALQSTASDIATLSASMKVEAQGPLWNMAELLPVVGGDVSRVRTLVSVADDLSTNVITPIASGMAGVSTGTLFSGGQVNVDMLTSLCGTIEDVQPAISQDAERVDSLGEASLDQVKGPLQSAREKLDDLNDLATDLSAIAPSLPSMLGANGTRHYLVVAQNNSEIRATGGFPGSRMLMTVDNGNISLSDFQPIGQWFNDSSIPVTDEEGHVVADIMSTAIRRTPGDVNAVPSFPRAAQLMEWCWVNQGNPDVDGVFATDPVFLQSLLELTGGFTASDGTQVDGTNAAQLLLNQVYYLPVDQQDPFFNDVATRAVDKVMDSLGDVSMDGLVSTVSKGISDHRVLLYMNDEEEERGITQLGADGEVNHDPQNPVTGVYLFDNTWSKIDWYLDFRTSIGEGTANSDGSTSYPVTVTLHNTTTNELMEELPSYISGSAPADTHAMRTSFILMAPAGGSITDVQVNADELPSLEEASLYGNDVWAGMVFTYPSNTTTFSYTVTTSPGAKSALQMHATPTGRTFE